MYCVACEQLFLCSLMAAIHFYAATTIFRRAQSALGRTFGVVSLTLNLGAMMETKRWLRSRGTAFTLQDLTLLQIYSWKLLKLKTNLSKTTCAEMSPEPIESRCLSLSKEIPIQKRQSSSFQVLIIFYESLALLNKSASTLHKKALQARRTFVDDRL